MVKFIGRHRKKALAVLTLIPLLAWCLIAAEQPSITACLQNAFSVLGGLGMILLSLVLKDQLAGVSRKVRAHTLRTRLDLGMRWGRRNGWFPLFGTFTVADHYYSLFSRKGGEMWSDCQRAMTRDIRRVIHGSADFPCQSCCYDSACVVERGPATNRLHLHFLISAKDVPDAWKRDPMRGPSHLAWEIPVFSKYWRWGFSAVTPIRYDPADVWGMQGHHWPFSKFAFEQDGTERHQEECDSIQVASYLVKYLAKSSRKEKGVSWRSRISRLMGLRGLRKIKGKELLFLLRNLKLAARKLNWPGEFLKNYLSSCVLENLSIEDLTPIVSLKERTLSPIQSYRAIRDRACAPGFVGGWTCPQVVQDFSVFRPDIENVGDLIRNSVIDRLPSSLEVV